MPEAASTSRRSRLWGVDAQRAVAVFVAFAVTLGGLHTILQGAAWWVLCVVLCVAVLGSGVIVRAMLPTRKLLARVIAPLVALIVTAIITMLRFGGVSGQVTIIPTADTWERFAKFIRDAGYSITWQTVPARADEPIVFVLALAVIVLAVVAEIVVFSLRIPALVGLPLAAIFLVPGLTPEGKTDGWFFAASAFAFLAVLLVGRHWRAVPALAMGSIAVVGGLVLPTVLPSTDFALTTSGLGPSVSTGVNPLLHLGRDLRDANERTALTYSTVSGEPEYLRLAEISNFAGTSWRPGQPSLDSQNRLVEIPAPTGLSPGVTTVREVTYVHVANLVSSWLPLPYAASRVTGVQGSFTYLSDSLTAASSLDLARGENYTVASRRITPTPEQLLSASASVPEHLERYLNLPVDTPDVIERAAATVTEDAHSQYEKALALQEYLRSEPFRYSETAPQVDGYDGTGVEYVAAFLEQYSGYCIHFASAMAVMAREVGIPSRIMVGFQPGTLQSATDQGRRLFKVTTKDLHAWPELFFDRIGWIRFEPTPSRGSVPEYANQTVAGVPVVGSHGAGGTPSTGRDPGVGSPEIDDGSVEASTLLSDSAVGWRIFGGVLAVFIALGLTPATFRKLRRWRRLAAVSSGRGTVVLLWREILESAEDVGNPVLPTFTPREAAVQLKHLRAMTEASCEALERVAVAIERESYGPRPVNDTVSHSSLITDTRMVIRALAQGAPPDERLRAIFVPPSLVARTKVVMGKSL